MRKTHQRRIAIYTRTASPEEPGARHALEQQREACRQVLNQRFAADGYEYTIYDEGAASGAIGVYDPAKPTKPYRPVLSELVKHMQNGEYDAVCVHRIDRLGRNLALTTRLLTEVFPQNGVELISVVPLVQYVPAR